jgi:hypothetical protein
MTTRVSNGMSAKFDALVKNLDHSALEALRRSLASEIEARGESNGPGAPIDINAIHLHAIRPGMSAADKEQAAQEIARVLRERG